VNWFRIWHSHIHTQRAWISHKCTLSFARTESRLRLLQTIQNLPLIFHVTIRGGVDKSLARSTSRYRRTESIVSLERGVCSCAELQVFSCYRGWKEACQATRAISTTWRRELSSSFFFLQGKALKKIHTIPSETGEYAPWYATVKNWVAQLKCGDFSTCDAPRCGRLKTVTGPEINYQIHELIVEDRRISTKSIAE